MSKSAILSVKIVSDASKAKRGFDDAEKATEQFERGTASRMEAVQSHLAKASAASTAAATAYGAFARQTIQSASEMEQSTGAVNSVFKDQAQLIKDLAAEASQSVGLAAAEYQNMAAVMGSQLKNLGIAQDEIVPTTEKLISLGADLSSMFGGTTSEAVSALSSLLRGERDPIERYAVSINQAAIDAHLAAQGLTELEGEAKKQAETQATLELLFNQTSDALGNFAREADTVAGAQQRAAAEWENAKAALGEQFLPIAAEAARWAADFAKQIAAHPEEFKALGSAILIAAGTFSVLYAASTAISVVQGATAAWTAVQWLLNAALTANPIGVVVVAIGALIAGIVLAYQHCDWFRESVNEAWELGEKAFYALGVAVDHFGSWLHGLWEKTGTWEGALSAAKEIGVQAFDLITLRARIFYDLIAMISEQLFGLQFPDVPDWLGGNALRGTGILNASVHPDFTGELAPNAILKFFPEVAFFARGMAPEMTAAHAALASPSPTFSVRHPQPTIVNNITINGVISEDDAGRELKRILEEWEEKQRW